MPWVQPLRNDSEALRHRRLVWSNPSRSYHSVLPGEIPSRWAAATARPASVTPWFRALGYFPLAPGWLLIVWSPPYRGNLGLHGAWGPRVIGSRRQPLRSWVEIQVGVRLGWLRQPREAPEM